MKHFDVVFCIGKKGIYEIEAESEEQAENLLFDRFEEGQPIEGDEPELVVIHVEETDTGQQRL